MYVCTHIHVIFSTLFVIVITINNPFTLSSDCLFNSKNTVARCTKIER